MCKVYGCNARCHSLIPEGAGKVSSCRVKLVAYKYKHYKRSGQCKPVKSKNRRNLQPYTWTRRSSTTNKEDLQMGGCQILNEGWPFSSSPSSLKV